MKRLLVLSLALFSAQVYADWELIGNVESGTDYFIDKSTIRNEGGYKLVWLLRNYSSLYTNTTGDKFQSVLSLRVYNCLNHTAGGKSFIQYYEAFGAGNIVYTSSPKSLNQVEFSDVIPGTIDDSVYKVVCSI